LRQQDTSLTTHSLYSCRLFTLDLAAGTWTRSGTESGLFDLQPDQLGRISGQSDMLYFCEDGPNELITETTKCDIHARNTTSGEYLTIVRGDDTGTSENTGLAFSPDAKFMYVSYQLFGVYQFWRSDGQPFNGTVADTRYHNQNR